MKKYTCILIFSVFILGQSRLNAQLRERVYLQTDKQLYLTGELLWIKMYTTDMDGKLTSFSKTGYVELIHDSIPEVQAKIEIRNGTGTGWMELPTMIPTGYYRMKAYTRYMRNEGESTFFEKTICIVNPFAQGDLIESEETNTSFALKHFEKNAINANIATGKQTYSKRSKGEIRLTGLPSENISLGISIAGFDPVLEANTSIVEWKKQLPSNSTPFDNKRFLPEYEGEIIEGVLIDQETGNPAYNKTNVTTLLTFPGDDIQLYSGKGDENGNVTFFTQGATGKQEFVTTSIDPFGGKYRVDIRSPYAVHTPIRLPIFRPDSTWRDYLQKRNLSVQVAHAYTADSLSIIKKVEPLFNFQPYDRYMLDDYTRFTNMEELFIEFVRFVSIRRTNAGRRFTMHAEGLMNTTDNVLVLFDNIPIINHEVMCNYNPLNIKSIETHIGRYLFGGLLYDGITAFFSYKNDYPGITFDTATQLFDYEGAQPYRFFYAPDYDELGETTRLPDFRHTLLWEPSLQTKGKNELVLPFTTSYMSGKYLITVEGIGANGTIVYANQMIEVE